MSSAIGEATPGTNVPSGSLVSPGGAQGPGGVQGPQGAGLIFKGTVPTSSSLPTSGNTINDTWYAQDTGHSWVWNGTQWTDIGQVQGIPVSVSAGDTSTGAPGTDALVINSGTTTNAIFDFTVPRGSKWFFGPGVPPDPIPGALPGDFYYNSATSDLYAVT